MHGHRQAVNGPGRVRAGVLSNGREMIVAAFATLLALRSHWLLTADQQRELSAVVGHYADRFRSIQSSAATISAASRV